MEKRNKANKINKINEIHDIYSNSNKNVNENSNSKTDYKSEKLSICDDDSFSISSDISQSQKSYKTMTSNENKSINSNDPFENFCINYYTKGLKDYCKITEDNLSKLNNIRKQKLNKLIDIINENFKDKYDLKIGNYGSYFTDLSIEGSDMDICIIHKAKENNNLNFYDELYNLLMKQKPFIYNIQCIYSEIPLIKLEIDITDEIKTPLCNLYNYLKYEDLTRIKIDINVSDNQEYLENCEKNVKYVKSMVKEFPQIRPVLLFLKRYFKNMNMNKVFFGGISSYSLFLLVLNTIKSNLKYNLGVSQLLFKVLEKFSNFNFKNYGIGIDNYDYKLEHDNCDETLYILDPLTGKNVSYGKCKGEKLRKTFYNAYMLLSAEINKFRYCYYYRIILINLFPINSYISLLNSRIN
jgi:DNA polymerase sigma